MTGQPQLKTGSQIDVVLHLPGFDGPSLEMSGRIGIVWNRSPKDSTDARPAGMGCRFLSLSSESRQILEEYISVLSEHRPADPKSFRQHTVSHPSASESHLSLAPSAHPVTGPTEAQDPEVKDQVLGPYTLIRSLGSGGMGHVYLAEHRLLSRRVAIKRLHPKFTNDPLSVRRFFEEARIVNTISHRNIVEITDLVNDGEMMYYVMELIEGTTLLELLRDKARLQLPRILSIGLQLAEALTAVHDAGIIHRDLKPDNVLLTERFGESDFVKLLDFGIAKLRSSHESSQRMTMHGFVVGTPGYMAPEQVMNRELDARADLYALGILLHEMVSGRRAFSAPTSGELMLAQASRVPEPPQPVAGYTLPESLRNLIMSCVSLSPDDRPNSAREIAEVLRQLIGR